MTTGVNVSVILTTTRTVWEAHWPLIATYIVFQIVAAIGSYWPSGFISVLYSLLVAIISTAIGLFIIQKVVTVTKH
jgi:hypothetical protein